MKIRIQPHTNTVLWKKSTPLIPSRANDDFSPGLCCIPPANYARRPGYSWSLGILSSGIIFTYMFGMRNQVRRFIFLLPKALRPPALSGNIRGRFSSSNFFLLFSPRRLCFRVWYTHAETLVTSGKLHCPRGTGFSSLLTFGIVSNKGRDTWGHTALMIDTLAVPWKTERSWNGGL